MRTVVTAALAGVLAAGMVGVGIGAAHATPAAGSAAMKSPYIVTLEEGADARGFARALSISPRFVYDDVLDGFAAELSAGQVNGLRHNRSVQAVEPDKTATAVPTGKPSTGGGTPVQPAPSGALPGTQALPADNSQWGLDRIDQDALPLSRTYTYGTVGAVATAYVIDTGIYTSHADFGGRAALVYDNVGGKSARAGDCDGHGTHVAGTIGGTRFGVAKGVRLRGVRVLDCNGQGSYSSVIAGLEYVAKNHAPSSVANLSLGGPFSQALNDAVAGLVDTGVFVAVAAGNDAVDACGTSPASAPAVMTVGATDRNDAPATFSNDGACVDVAAPGVDITSDWLNGQVARASGTSMASPHVAGVAALLLSTPEQALATPATVTEWILSNAVQSQPVDAPHMTLLNKRAL